MSESRHPIPDEMRDLVLTWLRENGEPSASRLRSIGSTAADWVGDTEAGFHEQFGVNIAFTTTDDQEERTVHVSGRRMQSLWRAVVRGWPA